MSSNPARFVLISLQIQINRLLFHLKCGQLVRKHLDEEPKRYRKKCQNNQTIQLLSLPLQSLRTGLHCRKLRGVVIKSICCCCFSQNYRHESSSREPWQNSYQNCKKLVPLVIRSNDDKSCELSYRQLIGHKRASIPGSPIKKYLGNLRYTLNVNLNGLLVTRQIDNTSPGGAPEGKSVPGSYKRCKLGHKINRHFCKGDQIIRGGVILVPYSLYY